jgi:hypothetical protein
MDLLFLILTVLAIATSTAFYFLPAIIAGTRHARHFGGIFLLDLLFGWTVIGWLGTLIWACTDEAEQAVGRVPCPYCAEAILPAAKVCPHCRRDLPETFAAQRATFHHPLARRSPVPSIIVLVIFLILVAGAIYYRHMRFERNAPTLVSDGVIVLAD